MNVSVSIVSFRSRDQLAACLAGVRAQGAWVSEILVADNGSCDGSVEWLQRRHPDVRVATLGDNRGYAAAHNHNYARSRGAGFFVLNPDVRLRPGHLASLVGVLEASPRVGAVGGRLLAPGRGRARARLDSAGITWDRARTRFVDRGRGLPAADYARDEDVFGTCGAATLFRRRALEDVRVPGETPFAERLFMYYEDVDLAWRLRHAGWRVRFCPDAEAVHARGGSRADAAFVEYHLVRNRIWVSLRNARPSELVRELPGLALFEGVKLVQAIRRPHLRAALRDQLRGVPRSLLERQRRPEVR